MNESLKPILAELKQRLTELYGERLSQLILFGSQARGDATEDSDVDVLVVLEGNVEHSDELERISYITSEFSGKLDTLISTVVVWRKQYELRNRAVYQNITREGVQVGDQSMIEIIECSLSNKNSPKCQERKHAAI